MPETFRGVEFEVFDAWRFRLDTIEITTSKNSYLDGSKLSV